MESRDPDIFELTAALWARRALLLLVTAAAAAAALLVSLLLPREYRSTSEILVVRPAPREGIFLRAQDVPIRTIERLIVSRDGLAQAIDALDLKVGGRRVAPAELQRRIRVRLLPDMSVIEIDVLAPEPAMAQAVNDRVVRIALERYGQLITDESARSAAHLDETIREAAAHLGEAVTRLHEFLASARLDALEARLAGLRAGATPGVAPKAGSELAAAEASYHEGLAERARLESEVRARQAAYEELHRQRAEAAVSVRYGRFDLTPLSSASLPEAPARPRTRLNTATGAALGFAAAVLWILGTASRRRRYPEYVGVT